MKKRKAERKQIAPVAEAPVREDNNRLWLGVLMLVVVTMLAYAPALTGAQIWDDDAHITPPELRSLKGFAQIWTDVGITRQYYPVVFSVFWIEAKLWGDAVLPYHVVNVLLHCLSAFLLFRILQELRIPAPWLAAAVFALHPVHVESVAWISELKNTLSGVFFLSAALFYLRFDRSRTRNLYWISGGLFVLGLLSKTVIASLPAVLLVVFWWERGRLSWRRDVLPLIPFFVAGTAAGLFTASLERGIGAQGQEFAFSIVERCLIAGRVFWFYLGKLLWPAELMFFYPRWEISQRVWWQYLFPVTALLVTAAFWVWRKRTRAPLAAFLLFGGMLFPVLGFVNVYPFVFSFVADHFQYLASIAIIAAVCAAISMALQRQTAFPQARVVAPVALLLILATLTWRQARTYRDAKTVYEATLAKNPTSWIAHNNLAIELARAGEVDRAIQHSQRAVALQPSYPEAHTNLGNALLLAGRTTDAVAAFERTHELMPDSVQPKNNLAWLFATSADPSFRNSARALQLAEEAVHLSHGKNPWILRTAAAAYAENGRFAEAITTAQNALQQSAAIPQLRERLLWDLELYRKGRPIRR